MESRVAVIIGAGPGLGAAVARRLGQAGFAIALIARDQQRLTQLGEALQAEDITAGWTAVDVSDSGELAAAVTRFGGFSGQIGVLHHNAVAFRSASASSLSAADLLADVAIGTASLLTSVTAALPFMHPGGLVLATGGGSADHPMTSAASLGVQKAAVRNLVTALDQDLRARGIRAASLTVNGTIAAGTPFAPERIADAVADLVTAAATARDDWRSEVPFNG
ncbi:MAG: SDR family NAD(P)-dependent oxidoreductase [Deltaproteobacteria bacterium]|nr:SDR family NAD(P)-dependent oxidoreductase [Deltaproteobacteria bacterium]